MLVTRLAAGVCNQSGNFNQNNSPRALAVQEVCISRFRSLERRDRWNSVAIEECIWVMKVPYRVINSGKNRVPKHVFIAVRWNLSAAKYAETRPLVQFIDEHADIEGMKINSQFIDALHVCSTRILISTIENLFSCYPYKIDESQIIEFLILPHLTE